MRALVFEIPFCDFTKYFITTTITFYICLRILARYFYLRDKRCNQDKRNILKKSKKYCYTYNVLHARKNYKFEM